MTVDNLHQRNEDVGPQIDAAKAYLRDEGFTEIEDPARRQTRAFEYDLHSIYMRLNKERRALHLSYSWLSDQRTPDRVRKWLEDREVGRTLRRSAPLHHAVGTGERAAMIRDNSRREVPRISIRD